MLYYLKSHLKQYLCGEKHQYTTDHFLFFLKKISIKTKKMTHIYLFNNRANKNILGF